MNVLHIVTAFPRDEEDVITPWLGKVLLGLREEGVDARVLAPAYRGGGATSWRGVPVRRFRYAPARLETLTHDETAPDRLRHRPWYAALVPGYLAGGAVAAYREGLSAPDVVHVHWPVPHALFGAAARVGSPGRAAVVSSFYSVELRWIERRLPWLVPFLRWSIASADEVTAISRATADAVRAHDPRDVRVIPFAAAVDGSRTAERPAAGGDAERRPGRAPDGMAEVLFVGRLVERKGVETLVAAVGLLRRRRPVRLTLVGEGAWEPRIRAAVAARGLEEAVRMTGRIDDAELVRAYRRADVFVLPAVVDAKGDTEGLGVVLLEALRFGVPVVASDVGGIPDIVIGGETGWLVPPGDAAALASAIEEVLDAPEEARRRVERGVERVERRFSLPGVVRDLIACYESAVERRSRPRR